MEKDTLSLKLLSKAAPLLPGSSDRDNQHYHGNLKNVSSHVGYGYDEKKSFLDPRWLGWRPFAGINELSLPPITIVT